MFNYCSTKLSFSKVSFFLFKVEPVTFIRKEQTVEETTFLVLDIARAYTHGTMNNS